MYVYVGQEIESAGEDNYNRFPGSTLKMLSFNSNPKEKPINFNLNLGLHQIIMDFIKIPWHPQISNLSMAGSKMGKHKQFHIQTWINLSLNRRIIYRFDNKINGFCIEIAGDYSIGLS